MGLRIQIFDPISPQCVIKPNLIDPVLLMEPGLDSQEEGHRTPDTGLVTVASEKELLDCLDTHILNIALKKSSCVSLDCAYGDDKIKGTTVTDLEYA